MKWCPPAPILGVHREDFRIRADVWIGAFTQDPFAQATKVGA